MIPKDTIDRIFQAARVEEVIGDFVTLKRSGANLKGLSPFADEKTPSFMVSPSKQIWKDFSSGKGGNVVTFLMEIEHQSYPEALRYLAKKYGIEIEERERTPEEIQQNNDRESMHIITSFAQKWFAEQMTSTDMGRAIGLSYFKERGFRDDIIEKFGLGYSPDQWTAFTDAALAKGYKLEFLEKTGMTIIKENENGQRKFDRFKGRVMFPIHTYTGQIAGFGGRTLLTEKKVAKYLNSPESEIYHKSDILYGLFQAKQSIVKNDMVYLVEGYTDVISLFQAGIENVVASSGTALTKGQIKLVKRLTKNITVLYDGDAAGIKASFRGIDLLLEEEMNVRVLTFPDGDDPDSYARKTSTSLLKEYLADETKDFIQFKTSLLLEETKGDPIKRAELIREIVRSISKIPAQVNREVYIQQTSTLLGISEESLFSELAQIDSAKLREQERATRIARQEENRKLKLVHGNKPNQPIQAPSDGSIPPEVLAQMHQEELGQVEPLPVKPSIPKVENDLMSIILNYGNIVSKFEIEQEDEKGDKEIHEIETTILQHVVENVEIDELKFSYPLFQVMYEEIKQGLKDGKLIGGRHFIQHESQEIVQLTSDFMADKHSLSDWRKKGVFIVDREEKAKDFATETLLRFKQVKISEMIASLSDELKTEDDIERDKVFKKLIKLTQLKMKIDTELRRVM